MEQHLSDIFAKPGEIVAPLELSAMTERSRMSRFWLIAVGAGIAASIALAFMLIAVETYGSEAWSFVHAFASSRHPEAGGPSIEVVFSEP